MKRIFLLIGLILTISLSSQKVPTGIIASQKATASAPSANMISNGTFDSGTGWDFWEGQPQGWSIAGGVATFDDINSGARLRQADADMVSPIQINTAYTIEFDISGLTSNTADILINNYANAVGYVTWGNYGNGHHVVQFTSPADVGVGGIVFIANDTSGSSFSLDNLTLTAD